jgi:hypothetical protein
MNRIKQSLCRERRLKQKHSRSVIPADTRRAQEPESSKLKKRPHERGNIAVLSASRSISSTGFRLSPE